MSSFPPKPEPDPNPATLALAVITQPPPVSRRLPPPCWSPQETSALINSYRDKWYSLRRANLRAIHWQQVSDDLHHRVPLTTTPKTAVQCRHKMEKLRKRYRAEIRRYSSLPHHPFSSPWVYFTQMQSLEQGPNPNPNNLPFATPLNYVQHDITTDYGFPTPDLYPKNGVRIKFGGNSSFSSPKRSPNSYPRSKYASINNLNSWSGSQVEEEDDQRMKKSMMTMAGKRGRGGDSEEDGAVSEMVEAIKKLGEGLVRMEKMKIEMMRETHRIRMEMEMRRTQMILESQHQIVEAFVKALNEESEDIE